MAFRLGPQLSSRVSFLLVKHFVKAIICWSYLGGFPRISLVLLVIPDTGCVNVKLVCEDLIIQLISWVVT